MKGILFKPEMIVATVEGRKTNTRRAEAGLREINQEPNKWKLTNRKSVWALGCFICEDGQTEVAIKPRYHIGEVVYVKEAYWVDYLWPDKPTPETRYIHYKLGHDGSPAARMVADDLTMRKLWQNPLFMPEWAARHFIKILDGRAERLQGITPEDAVMEGAIDSIFAIQQPKWMAIEMFRIVWNSINAKWKRVYNKELKIYEFWQFPWCEADAKPIPKTTEHPERYHCIPNPWVFRYQFERRLD